MSQRITWRSRPRSEYPWPIKTVEIASIGSPNPDYLMGPLTMEAVVEMFFRVKAFNFAGVDASYEPEVDEKTLFAKCGDDISSVFWPYIYAPGVEFALYDYGVSKPVGAEDAVIYKAPDGFYLRCWLIYDDFGSTVDANGGGVPTTINLILKSGTFPITIWGDGSIGDITATEWFPYKTTAGDPAWNTATGAPANGGPGA